jgi:hypothetical protein
VFGEARPLLQVGFRSDPDALICHRRRFAPHDRAPRGDDHVDQIDDVLHALDTGDELLGHLLQVIGGQATVKPRGLCVDLARDALQSPVAAATEAALSLEADG